MRSANEVFDLRKEINWELLRKTKNEKFDINVYPNRKCTIPISGKTIINLDRSILRYKRYHVLIVDVKGTQKLYSPDRINEKVIESLRNEAFGLILRTHKDARDKLRRISHQNKTQNAIPKEKPEPKNDEKIADLPNEYPKKDDIMKRLFGSDSDSDKEANETSSDSSSSSSSESSDSSSEASDEEN